MQGRREKERAREGADPAAGQLFCANALWLGP